jgi:putative ABC transport system permease protein
MQRQGQKGSMMRLLRNVFRRKLRAFLTIFGITIGVFSLVVMGSMAEKINLLVSGGIRYYSDKVTVTDASSSSMSFSTPMQVSKIGEIEKVKGVATASAEITMLLEKDSSAVSMGVPNMIIGSDMRGSQYFESFKITYTKGRALRAEDRGKVVLGSEIAKTLNAEVGKTVMLRDVPFEVVGLMDKTLTAPDNSAMISLSDAQQLFVKDLPEFVQKQIQGGLLATDITVYTQKGVNPDALAATIEQQVPGIKAEGPKAIQETVGGAMKLLNAIIFGVALISLLVGGLSVVNTMTMSVFERTREIGIRKAIGASHRRIVGQFLGESAAIGFLGGLAGLTLGWMATLALNAAGNQAGTALFLLTSRLAIGAVLFALVLGVVSGLYPSWHAARLNPVAALRYE